MKEPKALGVFMANLMKDAKRESLEYFLEYCYISKEEYKEIEEWFKDKGINL